MLKKRMKFLTHKRCSKYPLHFCLWLNTRLVCQRVYFTEMFDFDDLSQFIQTGCNTLKSEISDLLTMDKYVEMLCVILRKK